MLSTSYPTSRSTVILTTHDRSSCVPRCHRKRAHHVRLDMEDYLVTSHCWGSFKYLQNLKKNTLGQFLTCITTGLQDFWPATSYFLQASPWYSTPRIYIQKSKNSTCSVHYRAWKAISPPFHHTRSARFFLLLKIRLQRGETINSKYLTEDLDVGHDRTPVLQTPLWRATNLYIIF